MFIIYKCIYNILLFIYINNSKTDILEIQTFYESLYSVLILQKVYGQLEISEENKVQYG